MDDLISRQAAIDELIAMREHIDARMSVIGCTAYEMAIEALREPERKKGKWTQILNADRVTHDYRCSECHRFRFHNGEMLKKYKFCPNCGADMRGGEANETD